MMSLSSIADARKHHPRCTFLSGYAFALEIRVATVSTPLAPFTHVLEDIIHLLSCLIVYSSRIDEKANKSFEAGH